MWVIARKPKDAVPEIGKVYEIRHSRKGTFVGKILSVSGNFATVERIEGKIKWASKENRLFNTPCHKNLSIRDSLVYLIEIDSTMEDINVPDQSL